MKLRLGTRGSDLALTQSNTVAERLRADGHDVELVVIRTEGDRSQAPSFGTIGAQGVFVRDIEQALLRDEVDLAVHSFKDLPTVSPDGLTIAAIPRRVDAADVLLVREAALVGEPGDRARASGRGDTSAEGARDISGDRARGAAAAGNLLPLVHAARVGTSSVRRRVWLLDVRPDLAVPPLRGNVPTRVRKLRDGQYDAIVLAAAGVARLTTGSDALDDALTGLTRIRLDPREFVPAPAQGALAVQCRTDRAAVHAGVAVLDDVESRTAVTLERDALRRAEGGCNTAFGAYCVHVAGRWELTAMLERGGRVLRATVAGNAPEALGDRLWERLEREEDRDSDQ